MYYLNVSQGTLLIIYVDFLIMAREKGNGRWISFPVRNPKFQEPIYFQAGFCMTRLQQSKVM